MNAKDLLQLNEQLIMFNALIKGDLANEVAAAKAALDDLGEAQGIAAAQAKVDSDKAGFESYKTSVQAVFDETKQELLTAQTKLANDQAELKAGQDQLATSSTAFTEASTQAQATIDAANAQLLSDRAALSAAQTQLASDQAALQTAQAAVAARESAVQVKLAAIAAAAA